MQEDRRTHPKPAVTIATSTVMLQQLAALKNGTPSMVRAVTDIGATTKKRVNESESNEAGSVVEKKRRGESGDEVISTT